jgi:hypothetical protein
MLSHRLLPLDFTLVPLLKELGARSIPRFVCVRAERNELPLRCFFIYFNEAFYVWLRLIVSFLQTCILSKYFLDTYCFLHICMLVLAR